MDTDQYLAPWERFWSSLAGTSEEAFWDCDPVYAAQEDLARFGTHMDPQLPLLDVGCGNGTQTRFLAQLFTRVIGTEISPTALKQAKAGGVPANLSYRLLDLLRPEDAQTLHAELGDSNVYLRTVLHQLASTDQEIGVRSLTALLGSRGTLYLNELSPAAEPFFASLIEQYGPPPGLARIFHAGITPGRLTALEKLFPPEHFLLLDTGETYIRTTNTLPTGEVIRVPSCYALLQSAQATR